MTDPLRTAQVAAARPMTAELAAARGPYAGQEGHLDAPYAATPPEVVEAMLDLARLAPGERLLDLGCGDGRIAIAAALRGAAALGIDIDRRRVVAAASAARAAGVGGSARFLRGDLFEAPLGEADVITLYLLPHVNAWLRPRLLAEARPGARIVSHAFPMGDWLPDEMRTVGLVTLYLWTVPARLRSA